ncbi:MAG: replication restart helicase PriA [Cyclobacteriaceae bacterium]
MEQVDDRVTLFADVMLPVPIPKLFTYRVPRDLNEYTKVGSRVVVPFGSRKILTGVIAKMHTIPPKEYTAKMIQDLLDEKPTVNKLQLDFFQWIADYYMCTIGEVLNIALPTGLKLSSESKIQINPDFNSEENLENLTDRELELVKAAQRESVLSYQEIEEILEIKHFNHIIKSLIDKKAIILFEEIQEKYSPKRVKRVRLASTYTAKNDLEGLFKILEKNQKQLDVLLKYLQEVPVFKDATMNEAGVEKHVLANSGISKSSLNTLIKNKMLEEFEVNISRLQEWDLQQTREINLSAEQYEAKEKLLQNFEKFDINLLHGITGSGKTEIFIELIKEVLESGSQVLYLLPEIALTTQIVARLQKIFGDKIGIYHSKFSDNERVEVWQGVNEGRFSFVVGVRSSIFLPFSNLGLIIVDEEHETSYKQFDPAPRYHARDAAMVLARMHHSKVLLGSATPSVDTYYQAQNGRYGLVTLSKRFGTAQLPNFILSDTRQERQKKTMQGEFSTLLMEAIAENLNNQEQTIIFQNRRGYAPHVTCDECAWIPKCDHCAVSLTYHMYRNELRCHYCGFYKRLPSQCPACGSTKLRNVGFGTEKLEEDLKLRLHDANVQRMDLDTTRKKYSYQTILEQFEKGEIDILVGTQMVSKGLDFDQVSLVGIVDADRMLHFPDFRSYERTFHLVTQVSGRAGRREKTGNVIIQTANPEQPILKLIMENNFSEFYRREIAEREKYQYPPFVRLIKIIIKSTEKDLAMKAVDELAHLLKQQFGYRRVLGPEEPLIAKIRNQYLMQLLVKLERNKVNLEKAKEIIKEKTVELNQVREFKKIQIIFDVDPY